MFIFFFLAAAGSFSSAKAREPATMPATTAPITLLNSLRSIRFFSLQNPELANRGRKALILPCAAPVKMGGPAEDNARAAPGIPRAMLECSAGRTSTRPHDPRPREADPAPASRDRSAPRGSRAGRGPPPPGGAGRGAGGRTGPLGGGAAGAGRWPEGAPPARSRPPGPGSQALAAQGPAHGGQDQQGVHRDAPRDRGRGAGRPSA